MSAEKEQRLTEEFNKQFPVGSSVFLRKDTETVETYVRASAEVLGGHTAVAWFGGVSGAYAIENRVTKRGE